MKTYLIKHLSVVLFFGFFLILIFSTYRDYGVPWDEKVFFNSGKYYAIKILDFVRIPHNLTNNGFEPTPHHIRGHGVFSDVLLIFASLPLRSFDFETLHLIRALFALPIFFLVYWIVSRLLSKVYGLISLVFLLLFPRFYPEIYYNAVDVPTALSFTMSVAYFIYYASSEIEKQNQKSSRPASPAGGQARTISIFKSILFGLILAITINQRLLLFYLPIVNFIFLFFLPKKNLKQLAIQQLTIFISLVFFLHLTHPILLAHPTTGLFEILQSAKKYPWNAAVLFAGQFYQAGVKPLPWYYLPKSIIITTPLLTLILFFLGNIKILTNLVRPHQTGNVLEKKWVLFYLLSIFYVPFLLVFILKPTLYDSWRQFLFLTVPMIIIAMYGLNTLLSFRALARNLAKRNYANAGFLSRLRSFEMTVKIIVVTILLMNLIFTAKAMAQLHPYEYLYYNSLVGGLKGAFGKYETDYWGLGYKDAVLWFNKNINDPKKQYKIFVEGDPLSSFYYFKPNMQLASTTGEADYIFTFTRWNFHLRHPGKTIYMVEREGVPLIFIKILNVIK